MKSNRVSWFLACIFLFFTAASGFAQTAAWPRPLRALDFLVGGWTTDERAQDPETTEFHWSKRDGDAILVGRHWTGDANGCPWCLTQSAMVAFYDAASNRVKVRFSGQTQRDIDFYLVSASEKSIKFLSLGGLGLPIYRMTCELLSRSVLSVTLEQRAGYRDGTFFTVAHWHLQRQSLLF